VVARQVGRNLFPIFTFGGRGIANRNRRFAKPRLRDAKVPSTRLGRKKIRRLDPRPRCLSLIKRAMNFYERSIRRARKRERERERVENDRQERRNRWVDNGEKRESGMRRKKKEREDRRAHDREIYSARPISPIDFPLARLLRADFSPPRKGQENGSLSEICNFQGDRRFGRSLITLASSNSRRPRLDKPRAVLSRISLGEIWWDFTCSHRISLTFGFPRTCIPEC